MLMSFDLHLMDDFPLFKHVDSFGLRRSQGDHRLCFYADLHPSKMNIPSELSSNSEGKSLNQGVPSVIPSSTDEERSRQIDDRVWWDVNASDSVRSPGHRLLPCSVKKQPQVSLFAKGDHALVAALERLRLA
jgi:hypothetical protein